MMDEKRIRETINGIVERFLLGEDSVDFQFEFLWISSQLCFASIIGAITFDECDSLRKVIDTAYKTNRRGPECVDFQKLS